MKKLLIIALLFWGCDYAPTEHTHEHEHDTTHEHDEEIYPLIGRWNLIESEYYLPSVDLIADFPDYWILNDSVSFIPGEIHPIWDDRYLNHYYFIELKDDGTFESELDQDTTANIYTIFQEGVWFVNGNKFTSIYDESGDNLSYTSDFEITNRAKDRLRFTSIHTYLQWVNNQYEPVNKYKEIKTYAKQ